MPVDFIWRVLVLLRMRAGWLAPLGPADAAGRANRQHASRHAPCGVGRHHRPATLELCGDVRDLRVFDAGCGPGLYAEELIARGAREVEGVDASVTMVALARNGCGTTRRSGSMTSRSR